MPYSYQHKARQLRQANKESENSMTKNSKLDLFNAFANGQKITVISCSKPVTFAIINTLEREDGSNHNYNVTGIGEHGQEITAFVGNVR